MADSTSNGRTGRRVFSVVLVGLLIASAGCSAISDDIVGNASTDGGTTAAAPTTAGQATAATATGSTTNATPSDTTGSVANDGTRTTASGGNDRGATTTAGSDANTAAAESSANGTGVSGKMTVVVDGTELHLAQLATGDNVSIAADDHHTWRANSGVTLARALSSFGVDASANALTFSGTTYRDATNATTVSYRVNGEPVDPDSYTLRDGDQVWVTVTTAGTNYSVPGRYIDEDQQHVHGHMEFVVDGDELNFSRDRFQSRDHYFHFEGGRAEPWHAHSWSITLQYALDTLPGVNVTASTVTYNGTTYRRGGSDTTVSITVNDEQVDPSEYLLKDGDHVRVVLRRNGTSTS